MKRLNDSDKEGVCEEAVREEIACEKGCVSEGIYVKIAV